MVKWGYLACISIMLLSCMATCSSESSKKKSWNVYVHFAIKSCRHAVSLILAGQVNVYATCELVHALNDASSEQRKIIKSILAVWALSGWYGFDQVHEIVKEYAHFRKTACERSKIRTT